MTTEGADQPNTITENTMGTDAGVVVSIDENVSVNVGDGGIVSVSNMVEAGSSESGNVDDTVGDSKSKKSKSKKVSQTGNGKKKSRSFRVRLDIDGDQYGRYNGESPYQAANKALSEIIRNKVKKGEPIDEEITFFLIESTKDSKKKIHQYLGKRTKLAEPVKYKVKNGDKEQEITKEYKNILRKVKKSEIDENDSDTNETITEEKKKKKTRKPKKSVVETEEVTEIKESKVVDGSEEEEKEKEKEKEKDKKKKSKRKQKANNMVGGDKTPDDKQDDNHEGVATV
jgi:hypothetical protein